MKEKVMTVVMCIVAFVTLCIVIDSPAEINPNDPDEGSMAIFFAAFCVLTMLLGPVFKPFWMIVCLIAGATVAILCGTTAFVVYVLSAACITTMVKFSPDVQNMIRSLWAEEEKND